jgi:hypothetical protein
LLAAGLDRQAEDFDSTEEDVRDAKKREQGDGDEKRKVAETSDGDTER